MSKPSLTIFKNDNAGKPVLRQGKPIYLDNGNQLIQCDLNGKIRLPEDLPAGEYEVNIYKKVKEKPEGNLIYYSGTIKPAFKKDKPNAHTQAKQNGYVPSDEPIEDEIPF